MIESGCKKIACSKDCTCSVRLSDHQFQELAKGKSVKVELKAEGPVEKLSLSINYFQTGKLFMGTALLMYVLGYKYPFSKSHVPRAA